MSLGMCAHHFESSTRREEIKRSFYPEMRAGGFSRVDGTIAFYTRVNALLHPAMKVVDFGAGTGRPTMEDPVSFRRHLCILRGKVREVIGVDIDPAVAANPTVDRGIQVGDDGVLPFASDSIDMIISDHTFEHLTDPGQICREFFRVLRGGGWLCARTTNRWGYVGLTARLIPDRLHENVLAKAQPDRPADDIYPTAYALNSHRTLSKHFPDALWDLHILPMSNEPLYCGTSMLAWAVVGKLIEFLPRRFATTLQVFARKRAD